MTDEKPQPNSVQRAVQQVAQAFPDATPKGLHVSLQDLGVGPSTLRVTRAPVMVEKAKIDRLTGQFRANDDLSVEWLIAHLDAL